MSITIESSSSTDKTTQTSIVETTDDMTNIVNGHNKTLVIILAVTLPTLVCIALLTSLIICYRRRHTKSCLKNLENSSRLQTIVVNLSSTSAQSPYSKTKLYLSHEQSPRPRTETIIYNRFSAPSTPIVNNSCKSPIQGETNAAFDEYLTTNEQQPILRSSSNIEQHTTTLTTDFPISLQAPARIITSTLVEAIAAHRFLHSDASNASLETLISTNTSNNNRHSGASSSCSNASSPILLFSQRTEF